MESESSVLAAFVAALPPAVDKGQLGHTLTAALLALHAQGRAAWPTIDLAPERFAAHLAAHVDASEALDAYFQSVCATDLYLACACAGGIPSAVRAFDESFLSKVPAFVRKSAAKKSPEFLDDVTQVLREKLLVHKEGRPGRIADYAGRGSLIGWLRVAAVRAATSMLRNRDEDAHQDVDEARLASQSPTGDPELDYIKERYRTEFQEAFRHALTQLTLEQRNILRLHVVDELSIDKIGVLLSVHRATAARWIAAAREAVMDGVRRYLGSKLKVSPSQMESLSRLVQSQLHVSVARLLTEQRNPSQ